MESFDETPPAKVETDAPRHAEQGYAPNECEKHGTKYFTVCPDCADAIRVKPARHAEGEWTTEPVRKSDRSVWEGLLYINLPDGRGLGSVNAEQAKAICREHNASLKKERGNYILKLKAILQEVLGDDR